MFRTSKRLFKAIRSRGIRSILGAVWLRLTGSAHSEFSYVRDPWFDVTESELKANELVTNAFYDHGEIRTATWFIPYAETQAMGGRSTIYRFATFLEEEKNIHCQYAVLASHTVTREAAAEMIRPHVPRASSENVFIVSSPSEVNLLPATDIGIATKWNTAYALLRFNQVKAKFYFVQDFEPLFYPAGIRYAIAEATYRFGFFGIVNTPGLEAEYAMYAARHTSFVPAVHHELYENLRVENNGGPVRIVFYGRPTVPRNGFHLGIEALRMVKQRYGDRVQIITAGEDWDPKQFGLGGIIENRGLLRSLKDVAELYCSADIGLGLIFTKHTSYQPFEYMAAGAVVVTNRNRFAEWFLRDGINCLLAEPSASDIAAKISRLIDNPQLRTELVNSGKQSVATTNWLTQFEHVWTDMNAMHPAQGGKDRE